MAAFDRSPGELRIAPPVPLWVSLLLGGLLVLAMGYVRLSLYPNNLLPLSYGVALLVCIWHRSVPVLYGMAFVFSAIAVLKMVWRSRYGVFGDPSYEYTAIGMILTSIWIEAGVIHGIIRSKRAVEAASCRLMDTNAELEVSNEELAAREEEIVRQNEELQSQNEELEQQAEELRQQTEEMERQSAELHLANDELARRDKGLQTLLESARWLRSDVAEHDVMGAICQAAVEVMDDKVDAAAIIQERQGNAFMRGQWGFGIHGTNKRDFDFSRSFAAIVMEKKKTAYIEDLSTREDIETPQPVIGRPFCSVLASPVWSEGRVIGAVEIYSREPRQWTVEEFSVAEWLAAQTALAIQTIEYQKELQVKRREAEEATIQKTRFLAAVSHDVRTPANAISLMADLVERMANDPSKVDQIPKMVRSLKSNARALVELVSDVLDLARFDSGKLDLQLSEFSLGAVVDVELRQFQHAVESRGLKLLNSVTTPLWIRTDKMKLARILANLVGNAVKFTDVGEIRVAAERTARGEVHLTVSDTGVGMPAEQLPRIFDEFYQLQNPERDRNKGTGLGLAICRRLVGSLGCTLSVESAVGRGTTFTIRLPSELVVEPREHSSDTADSTVSPDEVSSAIRGLQILLVEDHDATRAATAAVLASHGAVVTQASTCRSAVHLLAHETPDVLLLDMMLPDRDGTEVLRHLQHNRPASLRCVLAVSGDVRPERVDEVRRLGADDLLPKPLTTDRLLKGITSHLHPRRPPETFLDTLGDAVAVAKPQQKDEA